MPAIRRPSVAEPLWSWGEKRWTAVSVCLVALSQSSVYIQYNWMCVFGCMFFFCHLLTCFYYVALHSFHHHRNCTTWTLDYQTSLFASGLLCLRGFQVPSVLPAGVPWGREGVVEVPFNRGTSGHRQPIPTVSWSFLHHYWKIPLLQPAYVYTNNL